MQFDDDLLKTIVKEIRLSRSNGGYIEIEKAETRPNKLRRHAFQFVSPEEMEPEESEQKEPEPIKHDPAIKHTIPKAWVQSVEDEGGYALVHCNAKSFLLTENYAIFMKRLGWILEDEE